MTTHDGVNSTFDSLRLHLLSEHKNLAALGLTDAEAAEQHTHEHRGPGTARDHHVTEYFYDSGEIARLFAEEHAAQAHTSDQVVVALTPVQALAVAAGRPHVGRTTDGRRVHVRLYTPYEWIAERAGAGDTVDYDRAEQAVTPAVLRQKADPHWVPAPDCGVTHPYGGEGWRPGSPGSPHEHRVDGETPADPAAGVVDVVKSRGAQGAVVIDGSGDATVEAMVAAGWTLEDRVDRVNGKRIRYLSHPERGRAELSTPEPHPVDDPLPGWPDPDARPRY